MNEDIKEKLSALSLKEILGYAIHSEDVASTYYWTLANIFDPNDLVKAKFKALSNDEKIHKETLLNLYKKEYGNEDYTVPEGLPPFESVVEVKTVDSFMEAIETAMQNERNAHDTYMLLAKQHKEHKRLFKYLAKTEMGHYETIKQDLEFVREDYEEDSTLGARGIGEMYARPGFRPPDLVR